MSYQLLILMDESEDAPGQICCHSVDLVPNRLLFVQIHPNPDDSSDCSQVFCKLNFNLKSPLKKRKIQYSPQINFRRKHVCFCSWIADDTITV